MDTIANRCKIIKKIRNNQIKSDINASTVGEKLLIDDSAVSVPSVAV